MNLKFTFANHDNLRGTHALFSPSQSSWLNYDEEKIASRVFNQYRNSLGTEIHEYASMKIDQNHKITNTKSLVDGVEEYIYTKYKFLSNDLNVSSYGMKLIKNVRVLPKEVFEAVRFYINDGVGYKMTTEQPLIYSERIYGTTDAISFRENFLRIHDLKTGDKPAHIEQLYIYAALFCLEYGKTYGFKPRDLSYECRIYQWDGVTIENPTPDIIDSIIEQIILTEKVAYGIEKED